ncbi:septal ring lytic transglycosylase RlpA family protein [Massilia niastensis]|uniref:septal ring lytic transglycosylase RlpA family protein n=1 Tax=Massilia niastensis TaxID=544911 RepID=UPI001E31B23D|nr:septal ring lytic transglycosylase RlpA family protein [Massilia niastensis]
MTTPFLRYSCVAAMAALLAACSSTPVNKSSKYYLDDGPMKGITQEMVDTLPEPVPRREPLHKGAARPYEVLGRKYMPMTRLEPFRQRGLGSWYGTRYHGKKGSIGEPYDMLQLTAAHPILPLPSYARVTNLENGKSVVVRLNDRGPFLHDRIIDLSYAAAMRLGYAKRGSAKLEVELLLP